MNRPFRLPNASPIKALEDRDAVGRLPYGYFAGLQVSNDTTDGANGVAIAAGACRSSVSIVDGAPSALPRDQVDIEIPVSIVKNIASAWRPANYDAQGWSGGGSSGGRSSSTVADVTWHLFAIGGPGVQPDVLMHDSVTQSSVLAALPGGYTAYRRIGSILRESSSFVPFTQIGAHFYRTTAAFDVNATNPGTSAVLATLKVPSGIKVLADISYTLTQTGGSTTYLIISDPATTDSAASVGNANGVTGSNTAGEVLVGTNTSAQVRYRVDVSNAGTTVRISPRGWIDDVRV